MHLLTELVASVAPVDGGAVSYAPLLVGLPLASAAVLLLLKKIKARREGRDEQFKHELLDFTLVRRESDGPPSR